MDSPHAAAAAPAAKSTSHTLLPRRPMHPQGSSDLTTWVDLKRHANDTTIKVPGQYASWPVIGPAAAVPYRAFRLLLTGPNASPNPATRNTFSLSNLELYGYLSKGGSGGEEGVEGGGPGPGSAGGSGA